MTDLTDEQAERILAAIDQEHRRQLTVWWLRIVSAFLAGVGVASWWFGRE